MQKEMISIFFSFLLFPSSTLDMLLPLLLLLYDRLYCTILYDEYQRAIGVS